MNFNINGLFGGALSRMNEFEECEALWKELCADPASEDEKYWRAVDSAYGLLAVCLESDSVPKEVIGVYTAVHDFAVSESAIKKAPVWAAVAEALSGLAAYSIVETPIEGKRSLRAFTDTDDYIVDIDAKTVTKE